MKDIIAAIRLKIDTNNKYFKHRGNLYPNENIALRRYGASVISGELRSRLLNSELNNYDFINEFTDHEINIINQNSIIVKLAEKTIINQIKLLLWDKDTRFFIDFIFLIEI